MNHWTARYALAAALESEEDRDRLAAWLMAAACLLYVTVAIWLTRGSTFFSDNLNYFADAGDLSPDAVFAPYAGHLTATTRLIYEIHLRVFGPNPFVLQVAVIGFSVAAAALTFLLVRRSIGAVLALPLCTVVLVLGSTEDNLQSYAIMWPLAVALGLAAILAIERHTRRWDLVGCGLLVLSVLSLEIGIAFGIAAGVMILSKGDRVRRLWIAVVPIAVYGCWWLWARQFDDPSLASVSNLLRFPSYAFDQLASGAVAFTGVDAFYDYSGSEIPLGLGRVLASGFLLVVAIGVLRGGRNDRVVAAAAFLAAFMLAGTLSYYPIFREPTESRYVYPVVIGMVILFAPAMFGARRSLRLAVAVWSVAAFAIVTNLWLLRERAGDYRVIAGRVDAGLAVIELERDRIPAGYAVPFEIPDAAAYLTAIDRWGRPGYPPEDLAAQQPLFRQQADRILGEVLTPTVRLKGLAGWCRPPESREEIRVPAAGARLTSRIGGEVLLRRFGDAPSIEAGNLPAGRIGVLELPADGLSRPWLATLASGGRICVSAPRHRQR